MNIKQFIRKHNYEVKAALVDSNVIFVSYPTRKESPSSKAFQQKYEVNKLGITISLDQEETVENIIAPIYAFKTIIFSLLYRTCQIIKYDNQLVSYFIQGLEVTKSVFYQNMLEDIVNTRYKKKSDKLFDICVPAMLKDFSRKSETEAAEHSVSKGYEIVRRIWIGGKYNERVSLPGKADQ